MLYIGARMGVRIPMLAQQKRFASAFWSDFAQSQVFPRKFRAFSEPWFVSCIFPASSVSGAPTSSP